MLSLMTFSLNFHTIYHKKSLCEDATSPFLLDSINCKHQECTLIVGLPGFLLWCSSGIHGLQNILKNIFSVPNPQLSHCYKNQKRLVDQTSLLLIISLTLTTFTASSTVSSIELYETVTHWTHFNQNLKISLILELSGCMLIAITALVALSKLFRKNRFDRKLFQDSL